MSQPQIRHIPRVYWTLYPPTSVIGTWRTYCWSENQPVNTADAEYHWELLVLSVKVIYNLVHKKMECRVKSQIKSNQKPIKPKKPNYSNQAKQKTFKSNEAEMNQAKQTKPL